MKEQHKKLNYQGSHGGSIFSLRKQKKGAKKDGGGKLHKIRQTFGAVRCDIHGTMTIKQVEGKHLRCALPATRREKYGLGCPKCITAAIHAT